MKRATMSTFAVGPRAAVAYTVLLLALWGCSGTPESDESTLYARISGVHSAMMEEVLILDGSGSSGALELNYAWALVSRPDASQAVLADSSDTSVSCTLDLPGTYQIELIVSAGGRQSLPARHTVFVFAAIAGIIHVDASYAGSDPDGTEARPFITIQDALDAAAAGDTIKVAAGVYNENIVLPPASGLRLYGGYENGNFASRNPAVFSSVISGNGTEAVVLMEYTGGIGDVQLLRVDGFSIREGLRGIHAVSMGNGGIIVLEVENCIIEDNSGLTGSNDYGAGIYANGMIPIIKNNIIRNNTAGKGGGLTVNFPTSEYGIHIEGNVIENNSILSDHGAGAYIAARKGVIQNNIFRGNRILEGWGWGGGMIIDGGCYSGFSDVLYLELSGNVYTANEAPSSGSGLFIDEGANVRMKNELIYANISGESRNGALYVDGPRANAQAKTIAENCTIADNTGAAYSTGQAIVVEGDSELIIQDSIFWGNASEGSTHDFFVDAGSSLTVRYCIYAMGAEGGGAVSIANSFVADPLFADAVAGDYHLKSEGGRWHPGSAGWVSDTVHSPGIDAGDPASVYSNEPAPNGGRVNLGAYGNTVYASWAR